MWEAEVIINFLVMSGDYGALTDFKVLIEVALPTITSTEQNGSV